MTFRSACTGAPARRANVTPAMATRKASASVSPEHSRAFGSYCDRRAIFDHAGFRRPRRSCIRKNVSMLIQATYPMVPTKAT